MFAKHGFITKGLADGRLEGTKLVIDHLPDHFIVLHGLVEGLPYGLNDGNKRTP